MFDGQMMVVVFAMISRMLMMVLDDGKLMLVIDGSGPTIDG